MSWKGGLNKLATAKKIYEKKESAYNPTKKRKAVKVNKVKVISVMLLLFSAAFCFTAGTAIQAVKVHEINELKSEVAVLESSTERLELKKAQLMSLDRIENIALNDLGMVNPEKADAQYYSVEHVAEINLAFTVADKGIAADDTKETKDFSRFNPYIAAISSLMSNWLVTR